MHTILYHFADGSPALTGVNPACGLAPDEIAKKDIPAGSPYIIIRSEDLPNDVTFIDAWEFNTADYTGITINMDKAKAIGHTIRRVKRESEFAPLDAVIMKQIPDTDTAGVEAQRQAIRDKYVIVQKQIDAAETPEEIKAALGVT